ncbi:MAG TPA: trypsin-like peptidase domain-containing protein [Bauldia sp.]|nr:trypsin-like peptidase domain-containing protein [Bauldia sp.]
MEFSLTIEPAAGVNIWKGPGPAPEGGARGSPIGFESGKETIVFGRETTSDVVFGPEHRAVGRKHCQLIRQPTGDYRLEIFGERAVEVNGAPAQTNDTVPNGAKLRFGGAQGPTVTAKIAKAAAPAAELEETLIQPKYVTTGQRLKHMRRIQAAVAAGLVVVVAGVAAYFVFSEQRFASMSDVVAAVAEDVQKEMVDQDFIDQLKAAAYAVIQVDRQGREVLQGTAWPVAPGILATNAHVANLFKGTGGDLIVRRPGSEPGGDGDFKVVDAVVHDGYAMFSKFDADTKATSSSYAALGNDARRTGYDVALLKVERGGELGPILPRAPEAEVVALDSGMPLAYAGYPIGGTAEQGSAQLKPTPTVQYGRITSVTDFFMFGTDPRHAYLVQHSLPTFKGASGSPIINGKGEVVAILSGGHVVETTEGIASNAVMRNFAQRIDLLAPLLGETSTFSLDEEAVRWAAVAERFDNHRNSVIEDTKEHLAGKTGGSNVVEVATFDGSLTGSDVEDNGFQRFIDHQVPIEKDGHYAFLVYGSEGSPISLIVYRDGETPVADGGAASFASADAEVTGKNSVRVRVLGLAKNPSEQYTLYVFRADPPAGEPSAALGTGG